MSQEPYRSARRVFWITDNGSSHRGQTSIDRLKRWYPNAIQVHTPIHASWLNQVEIYFSVLQRKVLTPNDFESLEDLESRILGCQSIYKKISNKFIQGGFIAILRVLEYIGEALPLMEYLPNASGTGRAFAKSCGKGQFRRVWSELCL